MFFFAWMSTAILAGGIAVVRSGFCVLSTTGLEVNQRWGQKEATSLWKTAFCLSIWEVRKMAHNINAALYWEPDENLSKTI